MADRRDYLLTLYRYKIHHVFLWVSYFVFWMLFYYRFYDSFWHLFAVTTIYFLSNAISFYATAYYLVPVFLYKKRYGSFFLVFFLVLAGSSVALGGALYYMLVDYLPQDVDVFMVIMMAFLSNATIVGIMLAGKLTFERVKSINTQRKQEKEQLEVELQYLKAQVNPHFLFNAINSVYILIRKDPEQAAETLIKLSDLLRFSLYHCSDESIPIENELDYIGNFIELEKLRRGKRVSVEFQTTGQLKGFMIAPLLLIPFLENAFKFVSNHSDAGNDIRITIARCANKFEATFFNTCDGQPEVTAVGGIGIRNVKRRLELLYPGKYVLNAQPTATSYLVTLSIDVA